MNFLKQIINILSRYNTNVDVYDNHTLENTVYHRLYEGVRTGIYTSDIDAARDIYKETPTDSRYRNLKSRLKRKLVNNLFFLDIDASTSPENLVTIHELSRQMFAMRTLATFGSLTAAQEIAIQILPKAKKFYFTQITIETLLLLQSCAVYLGKVNDLEEYTKSAEEYIQIQLAEIQATNYLNRIRVTFSNIKSVQEEDVAHVENTSQEVEILWKKYNTYSLFLNHFRSQLYLHQLRGDYKLALETCNEAEAYYEVNPHLASRARFGEIATYKNLCYFYLRLYDEGVTHAEKSLHFIDDGRNNWFHFMEEYFLMSLHSGNVDKARVVFNKVTNHINFDTSIPQRKETWEIFGLYLSFVEGKGNPDMDRFMKDMEVFRYDKSGVYVAVLALSILILLRNGDYPTILTRDEYIKKYLSRYLKGDDHVRSAAFFRLLRLMIRKEFRLPDILRLGAKEIAVLHDQSLRLDDYEVMPYEKMWQIVVQTLEEKARTERDIPL